MFELGQKDNLQVALTPSLESKDSKRPTSIIQLSTKLEIALTSLESLLETSQRYELNFISLPIKIEKWLPSIM